MSLVVSHDRTDVRVPAAPTVPRYRFAPTSTVMIEGTAYVPASDDEHGHVMRRADNPLVVESFTHDDIHALVEGGLLIENEAGLSVARSALALAEPACRLSDLTAKERRTILFRQHMCDGMLRLIEAGKASRSDASMSEVIPKIYGEYVSREIARQTVDGRCGTAVTLLNSPSPTTLRKWLRRYERLSLKALSLRRRYHASGNTVPRLGETESVVIERFAQRYASRRKPTQASLLLEMKAVVARINRFRKARGIATIRCPGKTALANRIAAMNQFHVLAGREGVDAARRRLAIVRSELDVTAPLERVEMDECKLPLQKLLKDVGAWKTLDGSVRTAVEKARLWVSTAVDTRSRCFLALRLIRNPCAAAAVATLEMAVSDKTDIAGAAGCRTPWDMHGGIDTIAVDGGSAYISDEFSACVADLGCELLRPPAKQPRLRGTQERVYGTIHTALITMLDGRSFANVVEKGDYESEANATLDEVRFGQLLVRYIVDIYHNTPHAGLGGQTPRNAWLELRKRFGVPLPPTAEERRHIFGTLLERRVTKNGVRFMGLFYQSPELYALLAGRSRMDVLVRVDPSDLGSISVRMPNGRLTVPCRRHGMDGVTLDHWLMAARNLRSRFKKEAAASEKIVLDAVRDIRAAAEGARRRAGIASPILDFADYARIEKAVFTGFERTEAEINDALFDVVRNEGDGVLLLEGPTQDEGVSEEPERLADTDEPDRSVSGDGNDEDLLED
ncbi:Mu transposase C-terminal domain-containing protein [Aureimonas phyllosphaerae]|uniref:Mu transposase C-terminal domain-containing protein n=1 Tax=Aureimonas phyllosphaerae TaxID=1166078 RepID=UPI003A5C3D52